MVRQRPVLSFLTVSREKIWYKMLTFMVFSERYFILTEKWKTSFTWFFNKNTVEFYVFFEQKRNKKVSEITSFKFEKSLSENNCIYI